MHVLLVSHRFPPDAIAGVERYTQALSSALVTAGAQVSIVTRRPEPAPSKTKIVCEQLSNGTNIYWLTGGAINRGRFLADHDDLERLFARIMIETGPDVVHFNHLIDLSPRFVDIARRFEAAVVLTLHDFFFACPRVILQKSSGSLCGGPAGGQECARTCFAHEGRSALLRWGLRTAYFRRILAIPHRIICPSQYVASYFEPFGACPSRTHVVPNGTWIEKGDPILDGPDSVRCDGTLRLAFLGAVLPHKGLHVIVDALGIAGLGSVDLLTLGTIDDEQYIRNVRSRANTLPGVKLRLYGSYEPQELPYLLQDIDCVIVPSQWPETFSLVAREALSRNIPVVLSRLGALPEAVVDGVNGFTFDHSAPQELADILRRLASDKHLLPRLREGARMTKVMSMAEHTDAVRTIYGQALQDLQHEASIGRADIEELAFLHRALLDHGFGSMEEHWLPQ
jgi:glycosyltransferase involved in cell wall biosynthesis